jgi:hypothetical protein
LRGVNCDDVITMGPTAIAITAPEAKSSIYTPLPTRFSGMDSHPKWTNLKCWYCDLIPSGFPKFIPRNIELKSTGEIHCDIEGVFSHWACAAEYCYQHLNDTARADALDGIRVMMSVITGRPVTAVRRPIPKTKRQCYCGDSGYSDAEYMKLLDANEKLAGPSAMTGVMFD